MNRLLPINEQIIHQKKTKIIMQNQWLEIAAVIILVIAGIIIYRNKNKS